MSSGEIAPRAVAPWVSERIEREVDRWLARAMDGHDIDPSDVELVEAVRRLRALPVYSDFGGTLLIDGHGEVHSQSHITMEVSPESAPEWRTMAWVAAADLVPELRAALPARPADATDCAACVGNGKVWVHEAFHWCGQCSGVGWRRSAHPL